MGTMSADQAFSASVEKSVGDCSTQSLIWGGVSAVVPIIYLSMK